MLIDLTRQTDKLLFVGMPSRAMRARCGDICYCPAPLGIVTLRKSLFDAPAKASPVQGEVAKIFDFCRRGCSGTVFLFALAFSGLISLFCTIPLSASLTTACGRSGRGSDSPPDCHSLPRLRFAYPLHKGAFGIVPFQLAGLLTKDDMHIS